jgi:hypothetical protein
MQRPATAVKLAQDTIANADVHALLNRIETPFMEGVSFTVLLQRTVTFNTEAEGNRGHGEDLVLIFTT